MTRSIQACLLIPTTLTHRHVDLGGITPGTYNWLPNIGVVVVDQFGLGQPLFKIVGATVTQTWSWIAASRARCDFSILIDVSFPLIRHLVCPVANFDDGVTNTW